MGGGNFGTECTNQNPEFWSKVVTPVENIKVERIVERVIFGQQETDEKIGRMCEKCREIERGGGRKS